ncbi:MAG: hypothetical protein GY938_13610 [Ketobacter sp.]|nr:hypothetical protein [Ketobacter sp.]
MSIGLSVDDGLTNNAAMVSSLSLPVQVSDSATSQAIFAVAAIYSAQLASTYIGEQTGIIETALTIGVNIGESSNTTAVMSDTALFDSELSISIAGGIELADAVTFAIQSGITQQSTITFEGSLIVGLQSQIANATDATLNATLALDTQLAVAAISQGILNAGLSLSCLQSLTMSGATLAAGLVTPDGRIITVCADLRTQSATGNRTIRVIED